MSENTTKNRRKNQAARATPANGLHDEIAMLRGIIRQATALVDEGRPWNELLRILSAVGQASTRLAVLLKAQRELAQESGLTEALNQALSEVIAEMGWKV
jgi:hypothetical protein